MTTAPLDPRRRRRLAVPLTIPLAVPQAIPKAIPKATLAVALAASALSCAAAEIVTIPRIQGESHVSAFAGQTVQTTGVVTAVDFNGFYLQDERGDGNARTSDALFVFTGSRPVVAVGDALRIAGKVSEFIPGGAATGNLSTTQIDRGATIEVTATDQRLPEPVRIGRGGWIAPNQIVISANEADPPINLQLASDAMATPFNPEVDGIDFYESLEGMRVVVSQPVAVSATRTFSRFSSELFVLADGGADAAPRDARTARGGILLQPHPENRGDQNPERVQVQFNPDLYPDPVPAISVGDRLTDVVGVMGYTFGNFEVNATERFFVERRRQPPEVTDLRPGPTRLTVASYNVLNLSASTADDAQRALIARHVVSHLGAPDVVALQEIQDNNGETDNGETDASQTLAALVQAIVVAGGPAYLAIDVAPGDNTQGGVPGGNIRNAFLYDPARVDLVSHRALTPQVLADAGAAEPQAFLGSRHPLEAVFSFRGRQVTVLNNHLSSRFGSTPVFGGPQPFVQAGEAQREAQVGALNDYVDHLHQRTRRPRVLVLGDLNTFEFTDDLREILTGSPQRLWDLGERVAADERYTFNFEGNSQALDHMFVSAGLRPGARLDIVHVNVDYPRMDAGVASDHEPMVARLVISGPR